MFPGSAGADSYNWVTSVLEREYDLANVRLSEAIGPADWRSFALFLMLMGAFESFELDPTASRATL